MDQRIWAKFLYRLRKTISHLSEFCAFGCGNPLQSNSFFIHSKLLQRLLQQRNAAHSLVIPFNVVTIPRMAAKHQHTISTNAERLDYKEGVHPAAAHHSDYSYIRRVLHSGSASQVSTGIGAPVAAKSYYLWLKVVHLSS